MVGEVWVERRGEPCAGAEVGELKMRQERQAEVSLGRVLGSDCRVRIDPDLPRWPRPSP